MKHGIREVSPTHKDVSSLLVQLGAHNVGLYGSADLHHSPPGGWLAALVAWDEGLPVGMIGLRPLDATTVHLLRLFVVRGSRRQRLATQLMLSALRVGACHGYRAAAWDTGCDIPAMVALSSRLGASVARTFGEHADDPSVRCYRLRLAHEDAHTSDVQQSGVRLPVSVSL